VYNKTGNDEVIFRASTDSGKTFGDKINLSNTTDADSTRVEMDSDADSVAHYVNIVSSNSGREI
jgi:hypothetical protein